MEQKSVYMGLSGKEKPAFRKAEGWKEGKAISVPSAVVNNRPFVKFLSAIQGQKALVVKGKPYGTCAVAKGEISLPKGVKTLYIHSEKLKDGGIRWTASDEKAKK